MSYVVATMKKLKASDLGGIQVELDRQYADKNAYKNDVNTELSNQNIELVSSHEEKKGSLKKEVEQYIDANKASKRKTRKDAVVLNSWIITSDKSFFVNLSREQTIAFFKDAKTFFANRYGEANVKHATIHFDETTPHMHLGIVPLHDGRLSSKTLITPSELRNLQADFPEYMQQRGWNIERGIQGSDRKHLDAPEYREATNKAKELRKQNMALKQQNKEMTEANGVLKNELLDTLESLNPVIRVSDKIYMENEQANTSYSQQEFNSRYGSKPEPLKNKQGRAQFYDWLSIEKIRNAIADALQTLKDFSKKLDRRLLRAEQMDADVQSHAKHVNRHLEIDYINAVTEVSQLTSYPVTKKHVEMKLDELKDYIKSEPRNLQTPMKYLKESLHETVKLAISEDKDRRELLADVIINLGGLDKKWRDSLVQNNGLVYLDKHTGETVNKSFDKLLPEVIMNASMAQLNAYISRSQDRDFGGLSR